MKLRKADLVLGICFAVVAVLTASAALYEARSALAGSPYPYERVFGMSAAEFAVRQYWIAAACSVAIVLLGLFFLDKKRRDLWRRIVFGVGSVWIAAVAYFFLI